MTVCKFWRSGTCRSGSSCRFEHPNGQNSSSDGGFGSGNINNRQGGFGTGGGLGNLSRAGGWYLNEEDIRNDLTTTRPKWILSAYGPGKEPPASLFLDNEYSAEEIRWRFYQAQAAGQADAADREAIAVWQNADAGMRDVAAKANEVLKYMESKEKEHPNRYDFTDSIRFNGSVTAEEFAKQSQLNTQPGSSISPFGNRPQTVAGTNTFSKPAFGDAGKVSPFGQTGPSAFGQAAPAAAFGKPAFGKAAQSPAFGQPAQPATFGQSGFGQAKPAFGQPSLNSSAFGGASPGAAFGQPSGLGQNNAANAFARAAPASGFGVGSGFGAGTAAGNNSSPFGQAAANKAFGSPTAGAGFAGAGTGFGAPAAPAANLSPFGQAATNSNNPSPFGQQAAPGNSNPSPFGNNGKQDANAAAFGQPAPANPSPFGQAAGQKNNPSPFGGANAAPTASPFVANTNANVAQPAGGVGPSPFVRQQPTTGQQQSLSPFGQAQPTDAFTRPSSGFGANPFASQAPQASTGQPLNSQPATNTAQPVEKPSQAQPLSGRQLASTSSNPVKVKESTKPTENPVVPLNYTQTLPNGPTQFAPDPILDPDVQVYKGMAIQYDTKMKPTVTGEEVVDIRIPTYRRPDGKGTERVWFPRGAEEPSVSRLQNNLQDIQVPTSEYTDEVVRQYKHLLEHGRFENGLLPLVPPMHAWTDFDF